MRALVLALALLAGSPTPAAKKGVTLDPAVAADPDSVAKLQAHLYHSSPMDLAAAARAMLESKGLTVPDHEDPLTVATDWQPDKKGGRTRYVVRVVAMSAAAARVQFVRERDGGADETDKRDDLDAEWALLTRVEPDAAEEIRSGAPAVAPVPAASAAPKPSKKAP